MGPDVLVSRPKISCHHYSMPEVGDIVMMTGNFTRENTISEFLPFSTFNCCHRYISVNRLFGIGYASHLHEIESSQLQEYVTE